MIFHECMDAGLDVNSWRISGTTLIPAAEVERLLIKHKVERRALTLCGLNAQQIEDLKIFYEQNTGMKPESIGKQFGL